MQPHRLGGRSCFAIRGGSGQGSKQKEGATVPPEESVPWAPCPSSPAGLHPTPAACPLHKPRAATSARSVF